MTILLNPAPRKESFGSIIGRGLAENLKEKSAQRLASKASQADYAQKLGLLEHEYGLKGNLEKQKQTAKQDFLSNLFGGQQSANRSFSDQLNEEAPQQAQFDPINISDAQIAQATSMDPALGRELRAAKDTALKERNREDKAKRDIFESERAYHTGFSKEAEKQVSELRSVLPKKEAALHFARDAVESGNLGTFSLDYLADLTGKDIFRTAKGAQLITAGKENLLNNMSRVSARAQNIWFEQRLNSMFPKIGQSQEANLTVQEMLEGETLLDRAFLQAFDKIAQEDEEINKFTKKDILKRVHESIKPLEKDILNRTSYRMKEIEEVEKGLKSLKEKVGKNVTKGTPLTLAMAKLYKDKFGDNALKVAEKNGYYVPTIEQFKAYQQRPEEFSERFR